jgi:hypothetical protein
MDYEMGKDGEKEVPPYLEVQPVSSHRTQKHYNEDT